MQSEVYKNIFAKIINRLAKEKIFPLFFLISIFSFLTSCASSDVARTTASGVDSTYIGARGFINDASRASIADLYQNANQATKGAVIGGAAGAVAGAMTTGVGALPGAATGAILGASYGSYIDSKTTLEDRLINRGVNIIILGDQVLMVIPSARLFEPMTSNVKPEAYSTLAMVAEFINRYVKMLVKVAAYTDQSGTPEIDLALSQEQADHVAKILEKSDVNARLLYATGLGGSNIVAISDLRWDSDNYRIEITFEKLYV